LKQIKTFHFLKTYTDLTDILIDHSLASLGDAFINFAYSLALSNLKGKPSGAKVKGSALAEAFRKAELRKYMPSKMTRHTLADGAEALAVYAWLRHYITLDEVTAMLGKSENPVEGLSLLFLTIKERIKF